MARISLLPLKRQIMTYSSHGSIVKGYEVGYRSNLIRGVRFAVYKEL